MRDQGHTDNEVLRGWRNPRFFALGELAPGAAVCNAILWTAVRRTASPQSHYVEVAESPLASTGALK